MLSAVSDPTTSRGPPVLHRGRTHATAHAIINSFCPVMYVRGARSYTQLIRSLTGGLFQSCSLPYRAQHQNTNLHALIEGAKRHRQPTGSANWRCANPMVQPAAQPQWTRCDQQHAWCNRDTQHSLHASRQLACWYNSSDTYTETSLKATSASLAPHPRGLA